MVSPLTELSYLEMDKLIRGTVQTDPFEYIVVQGFLDPSREAEVIRDFPPTRSPGSFPINKLSCGPSLRAVVSELTSGPFPKILGEKLGIDLSQHPTLVTVRGRSQEKDGQIHADNPNKLITLLLYLGGPGEVAEGKLRLLRSPTDLNAYAAEITPSYGTLLVFKNSPRAWHGFQSFTGVRRVIQINWVSGQEYVEREEARHGLSALMKMILPSGRN
ncbi:MAG: 2OG-Fe(II) oxygenase [Alphaproteobacteria bacterium]